jgi:hypothetical protein
MDLQQVLADPPKVHDWGLPTLIHSGLPFGAYARIAGTIGEDSRTLETGLGISTVLFACRRSNHICIAPDSAEHERLRQHCLVKGIPLDKVRFYLERSEKILPALNAGPLDLVLIDGCHGFPVAFFDFYYLSTMLRVGGSLVVDDIQIWTGRVLTEFLREEPEWELEAVHERKTAFFLKKAPYDPGKEWDRQPYLLRMTPRPPRFGQLRRLIGYVLRGDFKTIAQKLRRGGARPGPGANGKGERP